MQGRQKERITDRVMGKTSVFETVCTEERQQSLTPSSVEGEELRAGVWGWGH